ncbi:N-acetylglucosamine-6-phosphate deacetylase [Egibacter rhizosphaerae]|uniref:N-acetylglucosamine-6-phosphate deacetylase n=1 Tax=Egibacter rhizosphaerae TaxID=1670831 RepID=UPI0013F15228|nr:N-acetylglucosamine-6-phosphate deacetylase [Egibacter rhizosphaerae]
MPPSLLVTNARLVTVDDPAPTGWVRLEDGRIAEVGHGATPDRDDVERLDASGASLLPGFVDLHVHGAVGHDTIDGDPAALHAMAGHYVRHGVTAFLPTLVTADPPTTLAALRAIGEAVGAVADGATILGAHLEGPFISTRRKGAHREDLIRAPDPGEAEALLATGVLRLVTIAPELPENAWFMDACRDRGIVLSAGHTDATHADLLAAVDRGARHVTHVFNGMRGMHHREPGTAGAALTLDSLTCEVIADGVHVHPAMLALVWRAKGPDRMLLVTDAGKATGMPEGRYERGGRELFVQEGAVRLADGTISGSVRMVDEGLRTFLAATGARLADAWPVTSRTPARALGLGDRKGEVAPGYDADLVLLDDSLEVSATIVGGRVAHGGTATR